jgi:hypothetical protein
MPVFYLILSGETPGQGVSGEEEKLVWSFI